MKAYRKYGILVIEILEDALCEGTLQMPGHECRVTDREKFLNHIASVITTLGDGGDFNSSPKLAKLIDDCVQDAVESDAGVEV